MKDLKVVDFVKLFFDIFV